MPSHYIDPVVAEVRRARHQIAEECGHDLDKIAERAHAAVQRLVASGLLQPSPVSTT